MFSVRACLLPEGALLARYRRAGAYTDCYAAEVSGVVTQAQYVAAFYTTAVFKLERLILRWAVSRPSNDAQVLQLAAGAIDAFAAWQVEARCDDQLLLRDFMGRTRSWLMVAPLDAPQGVRTRLYFGSAVVPEPSSRKGGARLGFGFHALLGFHQVYSKVLLGAARSLLNRTRHR